MTKSYAVNSGAVRIYVARAAVQIRRKSGYMAPDVTGGRTDAFRLDGVIRRALTSTTCDNRRATSVNFQVICSLPTLTIRMTVRQHQTLKVVQPIDIFLG